MKILIADDVPDLVEVLSLMVHSVYPECEVLQAYDGEQAIQMIEKNTDLDIVLSDFNMPHKNGGDVFQVLRRRSKTIPFILVSTARVKDHQAFDGAENMAVVQKPFSDADLEMALRSFEIGKSSQSRTYVPILIQVLRKIGRLDAPVYLKLSGENFVKVFHPGSRFDDAELERFTGKGIEKLWIEFNSYDSFILNYKKEILSREVWKDLENREAVHSLAIDHQVILDAGRSFGWSAATVQMAMENVKQVSKLLERNPNFREVVQRLSHEKQSRLSTLSILLAVACMGILQELGWASESTRQKITFAALLHDMELDEDLLSTMMTALNEADVSEFSEDPSMKAILEHPMKTAEMLLKWPLCPPDVDVIIRQHHERPDGKGFPLGLDTFRIAPLAAVMIIAEDMIFHSVENLGGDPKAYLLSKKSFYAHGDFRAIFEAAVRSLGDGRSSPR